MDVCLNILVYSTQTLQTLKIAELGPPFPSPFPPFKLKYDVRRKRARSCHPLETYFLALRNLRILHLPCGMYLHATTIEKIATGEILPHLQELKLGSVDRKDTLSMIRQRNDMARYHLLVPGTSSRKPGLVGPCAFLRYACIGLPVGDAVEEQNVWSLPSFTSPDKCCASDKVSV
ncbi:hypothetical protein BDZ97DRAFT_1849448 [Flammula alnicola]|nr:hypothetical protein BDZ97DRAFT_1849448 [Flammula alnicola]